jgi:DNA-binding transcriptional regulator PaaX
VADSLYPTKTRLALLQAVADNDVWKIADGDTIDLIEGGHSERRVTAAIAEMERAGWVALHDVGRWELTDAGRAVLDGRKT